MHFSSRIFVITREKHIESNEFFLQINREMLKYIMAALFRMKLAG